MKQSKHKYILISVFIITVFAGIFSPGILLHYTFQSNLNQTKSVSKDYYNYSGSVISKNTSNNLSEYKKIKLISGAWDSVKTPVDFSNSSITQTQAANFAKEAAIELYQAKLYPYLLESSYGNWYSWEASLFQYTDTTFHTYTAYCWLVTFYKYNSNETHDILITETGTLLNIRVNRNLTSIALLRNDPSGSADFISAQKSTSVIGRRIWHHYMKQYYKYKHVPDNVSFLHMTNASLLPMYQQTALEDPVIDLASVMITPTSGTMTWIDLDHLTPDQLPEDTELYYIYQSHSETHLMVTMIPWE